MYVYECLRERKQTLFKMGARAHTHTHTEIKERVG